MRKIQIKGGYDAAKITVVKGKTFLHLRSKQDGKEEILKQVLGPSGNLRALTLRVGNELMVGFRLDFYQQSLQRKYSRAGKGSEFPGKVLA